MSRGDGFYLRHMRDHAAKALELVAARSREEFDRDEVLRFALTYLVQTVGEAASRVTSHTKLRHAEIPWRSIIAMRHRLVHGYFAVDEEIVWQTVADELPRLIERLEPILDTNDASP